MLFTIVFMLLWWCCDDVHRGIFTKNSEHTSIYRGYARVKQRTTPEPQNWIWSSAFVPIKLVRLITSVRSTSRFWHTRGLRLKIDSGTNADLHVTWLRALKLNWVDPTKFDSCEVRRLKLSWYLLSLTDKHIFNSLFLLSLLITGDYTIETVPFDHVSPGKRRLPSHFCRIKNF